jgi:hypothetical protein
LLLRIDKLFSICSNYPKLADFAADHYFHQDLLIDRYIYRRNPVLQIDIGSRVDGFVTRGASFRPIQIIDFRELQDTGHENIGFKRMDLMKKDSIESNICDPLSCLKVIEHFGLGRYGTQINPKGLLIGFSNLLKILKISFLIGHFDHIFTMRMGSLSPTAFLAGKAKHFLIALVSRLSTMRIISIRKFASIPFHHYSIWL